MAVPVNPAHPELYGHIIPAAQEGPQVAARETSSSMTVPSLPGDSEPLPSMLNDPLIHPVDSAQHPASPANMQTIDTGVISRKSIMEQSAQTVAALSQAEATPRQAPSPSALKAAVHHGIDIKAGRNSHLSRGARQALKAESAQIAAAAHGGEIDIDVTGNAVKHGHHYHVDGQSAQDVKAVEKELQRDLKDAGIDPAKVHFHEHFKHGHSHTGGHVKTGFSIKHGM